MAMDSRFRSWKVPGQPTKLLVPSVLSADFARLGEEIREVEAAGADWIHFDVMDGQFVPNLSMGPLVVQAARRVTGLPLDVHLMIEDPDAFIGPFAEAGADCLSLHQEASPHLNRSVQAVKSRGLRAGVALGPATPIQALEWVLEYVDYVLLMSVNPGFGNQSLIPNVLDKARRLREWIDRKGYPVLLQADGGIHPDTIEEFSRAGVNVFVAGSAIFGQPDYRATLELMRERAGRHP
jgi:ribulose-phosphate 3-epimerase